MLKNNFAAGRKGFTLTELLIGLAVVAVLAILIVPVVTTRAQNKSFAVSYETEVKQMLHSLEGLPVNENKDDISRTMMYAETDTGSYQNTSGAYINKYMKVSKYCGDNPGDCFGAKYYQYKNNDRTEYNLKDVKGACALLKNGSSIC
ncbi:prepilin-type N-terminal cleavage/methylation domain-containing protein [bacterium]|nr:prepilin-type N-terminal cleavage/methylation domain-containing protein [bacterium]